MDLVAGLIAGLIAVIIGVAVVIPTTISVIADTNFTGYTTTETIVKLIPLMVGVVIMVGIVGLIAFRG